MFTLNLITATWYYILVKLKVVSHHFHLNSFHPSKVLLKSYLILMKKLKKKYYFQIEYVLIRLAVFLFYLIKTKSSTYCLKVNINYI